MLNWLSFFQILIRVNLPNFFSCQSSHYAIRSKYRYVHGSYVHMYMLIADTFILQNCVVTSPSIGTIRVSCDSSHQIIVTLTCTNNCNNPMITSNGNSPLNVTELDPGIMYTVTINVFDGNQVIMSNQTEMRNITVMSDHQSGKSLCTYVHRTYVRACVCVCVCV